MKIISMISKPAVQIGAVPSVLRSALGDYWWAKSILGVVVLTAEVGFAAKGLTELVQQEAASTRKPAYTLKVITYGEGAPKADNMTVDGMQQNRRVDVSFQGVPVEIPADIVATQTKGAIWLTQDPLSTERTLNIKAASTVTATGDGQRMPVRMNIYTNYATYADKWEVLFYRSDDTDRSRIVASVTGDQFANESVLEWNGVLNNGDAITAGDELVYVLRVSDESGNVDETYPATLSVLGPERYLTDATDLLETSESELILNAVESLKQRTRLARQEIPIRGSRVRVYGRDLGDIRSVTINGESVTLDTNKDFVAEYLLDFGSHDFNVVVTDVNGQSYDKSLVTDLKNEYMFLVALADITVGKNQLRGISSLDVEDEDRFSGDIFVDGRLAFYLKGKVKGKYLITAQMDTGREDIDEIFNGLSRKDNSSVFRRLDPEQYYPVYGDDATLIDDTDSQGKLYVRVNWDQSRALWGNYNTGVTGTELAQFNRSLYGAQLQSRSKAFTESGDHITDVNAFVSEAQSAARHVEFKGTGGSLYYLRDTDVVNGSEKLWVEVRQRDTGRVIERIALVDGRDYQIDDIQGRIILNKPLRTVGDEVAPSIIKDTPLDGNELWLIADYEYVPDSLSTDDLTAGVRGKHWLTNNLALGGTWVLEKRTGSDFELKGIDATVTAGPGSWIKAEFAQSAATQIAGSFTSDDGGLNFTPFNSNALNQPVSGDAYSIEAKVDLERKFGLQRQATAGVWVKYRDQGFSSSGFDTGADTTDAGIEAQFQLGERLSLSGRATMNDKDSLSRRDAMSLQADYDLNDSISLAAELRKIDESTGSTGGSGTLAALRAGIDVSEALNIYGSVQSTLESSGSYESNDLVTLGVKTRTNERLSLNAEGSSGDRGDSILAGVDYRVNDKYSLYVNQTLSTDRSDASRNITTFGQRHSYSSKLRLYTEHQFTDKDEQAGLGHTFGMDYRATEYTNLNASFQVANLEDDTGGTTDRDALSIGLGYKRDKTSASSRIEYRRDESATRDNEQWLTANSVNYSMSPSVRWQGKLNFSETADNVNGDSDARFAEVGFGVAYRPVSNSRFNMLARVTHKHDLPPLSQSEAVDERSLVGSMEMAYQVNRLWEAGGKLALKEAEIRNSRDSGPWSSNDAVLLASRLRYHLLFKWDGLAEYHWLQSDASDDLSHGALLSLGKHVGDNLKFAVGYNFTRFDDSLLNDDADVKGWFVNLVGKY